MALQPLKLIALGIPFLGVSIVQAQSFGPTPYLQASDSPWNPASFAWFHLEDFEDSSLNVPGVSNSAGTIIGASSFTDSVDADDGALDGWGQQGHSLLNTVGLSGITFTFDAVALGSLPTHAGIVWTDGAGPITFEAFDSNQQSLGVIVGNHAGAQFNGATDEDRFYGMAHAGGIGSIKIFSTVGGMEVDHLQYGAVPEPFSLLALASGAALLARRRRRK